MKRPKSLLLIILVCIQLLGCDHIWNGLNRNATTRDFGETLTKLGTPVESLECRMFETTRDFFCSGKMTKENFQKLSSILNLSYNEYTNFAGNKICSAKASETSNSLISTPTSRPKEIPGYEYLVATFNPKTEEICFESSISYG